MALSKIYLRRVIVILVLLALTSTSLPTGIVAKGETESRAGIFGCPSSMPPPKIEGIHRGDWKINCYVRVVSTDVPLQGNIIIDFGGYLYVKNVSTVEQVPGPTGPFKVIVQSMTTLNIEKSTFKADRIVATDDSEILFNNSMVRSRGGIVSKGGLFTVQHSSLYVYSDSYGFDSKAELNISPKAGFIIDSTVVIQGANGMPGNATASAQAGGEAMVRIVGPIVTSSSLLVIGGSGGKGWDSTLGNGQAGAAGGAATVDLHVDNIDRLEASVTSGFGGQGGSGTSYQAVQVGGQGGRGGVGGAATLSVTSSGGNLTSSTFAVRSGPGGAGGAGGSSKGAEGGDGGRGANGGTASIYVIAPTMIMYNNNLSAQGGDGGQGGYYGKDYSGVMNGAPGIGGSGGDGIIDIHVYNDLKFQASQTRTWGGFGAAGGIGWQYGGNGGSGGNATISIFSGGNLTVGPELPSGLGLGGGWPPPTMSPLLFVIGGNGGRGEDYELGGGGDEKYKGFAGISGDGTISIESLGIATVRKSSFSLTAGKAATGRTPLVGSKTGGKHLMFTAARFSVEDSRSDTTFEGLRGQGLGLLRNTTVTSAMTALVWQSEPNAIVEVWWNLVVNFTPMFPSQNAEVSFFSDPLSLTPDRTCIIQGAWDHCTVPLKAEVITSLGRMMVNYSVKAETDDGVKSVPINVILASNRAVTLTPGGNFFAPHVNITYPEPGYTVTVKDLATGRITFRGMAWEDMRDPPTRIKDVELSLKDWRTGKSAKFDNQTGVMLSAIGSSLTTWTFELDLKAKDGLEYIWPSGLYHLCARSFDSSIWSDETDPRREGGTVCVDLSIFQDEAKQNVMAIPDTFPAVIDAVIPEDGNYVEVNFDTKTLYDLGASGTYFSFTWDFNSDGAMDWIYVPTTGSHPPSAHYIFTQTGIYTARLTLTDINGDVSTIETQINVRKAVKEPPAPFKVTAPSFCLPSILVLVIAICLVYLVAVLHEGFKFKLLENIMIPLDKKFRKELKHEDSIQRSVSDYVLQKPGRYFNKVGLDLELGGVTLARTILALEDQGYLVHKIEGTHVRIVSTRRKKEEPKKGLRPHQKALLKALIRNPWQTASELALDIKRSIEYTSRQLYKLEEKGLVVMTLDPDEGALYRVKSAKGAAPPARKRSRPVVAPEPEAKPVEPAKPEGPKPKCPGCGKDIKPNWMLCAYCGENLKKGADGGPLPAITPTTKKPEPAGGTPKCPGCGKEIKSRWNSCAYCGFKLKSVTAKKVDLPPPLEPEKPSAKRPVRTVRPKKQVLERLPPPPIPQKSDEAQKDVKDKNT